MKALSERLNLDLSQEGNRFLARREISALFGAWIHRHPLLP